MYEYIISILGTVFVFGAFLTLAAYCLLGVCSSVVRVHASSPAHMLVGLVIYFAYGLRHSSEAQLALTVDASDESSERERDAPGAEHVAKASYDAAGRTAPRPALAADARTSAASSSSSRPSHPPT